jgi:hypothetical protein
MEYNLDTEPRVIKEKVTNIFYVDAENGSDSNSGQSVNQAWASLEKVNNTIFNPGEKILFKAGQSWTGQLELKGSGTKDLPIEANKYGEGAKPAIHGEGVALHTLLLNNVEYWEVRNLEITNEGQEIKAARTGITVTATDFGDCNHIVLDSLEVHHINGSLVKKDGGGSAIYWKNSGSKVLTRFIDLQITNNYVHHSARNGIISAGYTARNNWHPSLEVIIRNNLLENIPGDGIVPIGTDGALIEYNVMRDSPDVLDPKEAAAGIWPWSADNTVIQFNEVSGHKAKWDGQGFDSDWNCQNTIIQYNYSHDNYGGFLLVCNNGKSIGSDWNIGTTKTIVRYNVSINDGIRPYETVQKSWFSPIMHLSGPISDTHIYNNVFIIPKKTSTEIDCTIVEMDNWGGPWPTNSILSNNIFYVDDKADFFFKNDKGTKFSNNNFYGNFENLPADASAVFTDPQFVDPLARGDGFEVLKNFLLKKASPLIGKGVFIENNGVTDILDNLIQNPPSIGATEVN